MPNPLYDALIAPHAPRESAFLLLPDHTALAYGEFVDRAAQLAHSLVAAGLAPGDRVAVQVEKSATALALYAASLQAGVVFLPLNTAYTADELSYFVENSGARLLVCDPARAEKLGAIAAAHGARVMTLDARGHGSLWDDAQSRATRFATVDRSTDDLAAFLYTSGTTGRSKGAMLTHGNLLSNARTLAEIWRFGAEDILHHALPIFHTHGLFVATNVTLLAGGKLQFVRKFDVDTAIAMLPEATALMGVPTFYTRLLADPRFDRDLVAHMRLFVSGSAPLLAETHAQFEARTGHRILERYGMTETNMNTSNPYNGDRRAGTVGLPLPGVEIRITDPATSKPVAPGEVGQIEVRGPNVFKGYWKMPDKTAAELRADGFFITGDLGVLDADGYLSIVGRDKDLIISGGFNIYPKEVELVLDEQPGVLESAVIGVPHADFGETVLALVVASPGKDLDLDRISGAAAASLARFKHPRRILIVDELPRNAMGKVQKNLLRERFKHMFVTA